MLFTLAFSTSGFFSFPLIPISCNNGKPLLELNAKLTELIQWKNNLQVHGAIDYAQALNKVTWSNPVVTTTAEEQFNNKQAISLILTSLIAYYANLYFQRS